MGTYTKIVYQIIFTPKYRAHCMTKNNRDLLFKYITGVLKNKRCHMYQINGVEDHLHILSDLNPAVALSDLIKDIKISSNKFIKEQGLFPEFIGWQDGYNAFTYQYQAVPNLVRYIQNQEEHHRKTSYIEEIKSLFKENGIDYEEKYL